ncbi:hypothetical protein BA062_25610 [Prauserella flavalba]|uniref:Uncharacterized protein n=1 Tax=Prauserella flavalba TaxID=1477506 RepID=A0A318LF05_9PSEU|nr:hypothetical protein BA062_25610 [Prauserella flavalba]
MPRFTTSAGDRRTWSPCYSPTHADHVGGAAHLQAHGACVLTHPDEAIETLGLAPRRAAIRTVPRLLPHTWRPHTLRFAGNPSAL